MRPLWWDFVSDPAVHAPDVDDQYMLGPRLLVAPVVEHGATSRSVYFPAGASWRNAFNSSDIVGGGVRLRVEAPLTVIPAFWRIG